MAFSGVFNNNSTGSFQSGGTVVINGEFNNAPDAVYSGGLVSLSGVFNNDGSVSTTLTVNSSGVFNNNAGATYTQGGIITINGTFNHPPGANFIASSSSFRGDGTFVGNLTPGGSVLPGSTGNNIGTLSVDGNYNNNSKVLQIQVNGTLNGNHDLLQVTGTATLSGTLQIIVGYSPSSGDQITVLASSSLTGTFAVFNAPSGWFVNYNQPNTGDVTISFGAPLPVELVDFQGKYRDGSVHLHWTTASERDNRGFYVERLQANGNLPESLGFVPGSSHSSALQTYNFKDMNPRPGMNYYRLRQVDFDGKTQFSKIVAVAVTQTAYTVIHPNPSDGRNVRLSFSIEQDASLEISVLDTQGKTILTERREAIKGLNMLTFDWEILGSGTYMVTLTAPNLYTTQRLVVQQ